jgi:hypothetical protein
VSGLLIAGVLTGVLAALAGVLAFFTVAPAIRAGHSHQGAQEELEPAL